MSRFTKGELEVMRILWKGGEMKPAELQDQFPRPIKNAALRSFLRVLVRKEHVTRRKIGKAFFYQAKTRQENAFRSMVRYLVDAFCEGSSDALFVRLIRSRKLSEEDLIKIKRLADEPAEAPEDQKGRRKP
jgi:predicted transcriptional regulator